MDLTDETVARAASFLHLEDVLSLKRAAKALRDRYGRPRAPTRSRVRAASRTRFWHSVVRVDADRKRRLARARGGGGGGFFERCAGLLDGPGRRPGARIVVSRLRRAPLASGRPGDGIRRLPLLRRRRRPLQDAARDDAAVDAGGAARLGDKGTEGEIKRDVRRTFGKRPFFQEGGAGRDALADVLVALAVASPETSYCQGMNLVCGALLEIHVNGGDVGDAAPDASAVAIRGAQRKTFWLAHALAHGAPVRGAADNRLELAELWRPGMPQLKLRVFQLDQLLFRHLPRLRAHLKSVGLAPDVLASQWFFTLFARVPASRSPSRSVSADFYKGLDGGRRPRSIAAESEHELPRRYVAPARWLPRLWDAVFLDGWKALYVCRAALP